MGCSICYCSGVSVYVLLLLLSDGRAQRHRQSRNPPLLPLSLTISRFPPPPNTPAVSSTDGQTRAIEIPTLSLLLSLLLPMTRTLPLSLDILNKSSFVPESKDEDLHSGILQLPKASMLLITEGGIQEGKLVERGLSPFLVVSSHSNVY